MAKLTKGLIVSLVILSSGIFNYANADTIASPAATPAVTPAVTPATTPAANPKFDFNCILSDSETGEQKDVFNKDTPMFYLTCASSKVSKGQSIKAVWIATDTKQAAPDNYQIDEKAVVVDKDLSKTEQYNAKFTLSHPDKGWPAGQYRVELFVDKDLIDTFKFSVN